MIEPNIDLINPSTIESVDFAFYDWLNDTMNVFCNTKDGSKKVPVIWVTPERSYQVKENKEFRDLNGALNPPMITVERGGIVKDVKNNATFYNNQAPVNKFLISKRINQKKTSEFANADYARKYKQTTFATPRPKNQKIVYEYTNLLLPVYATFTYNLSIFTQFQQQMNEIVQPFITKTGSSKYFIIERDGFKYECFIEQNFDSKNNISSMEEEERRYITNITVKVLAVLLGDGYNQNDTIIKTFENPVEIKLPRENIILAKEEPAIPKKVAPLPANAALQIGSNVAIKKTFLLGNNTDFQYVIQHNLNTRDMYVSVRENFNTFDKVEVGITFQTLDEILIDMGEIVDPNNLGLRYIVTIIG